MDKKKITQQINKIDKIETKLDDFNEQLDNITNKLNSNYPSRFISKLRNRESIKTVHQGDSMTFGMIQGGQAINTYPKVFNSKLKYIYEISDIVSVNKGVSGSTTQHGLDTINSVLREQPDIVFVMYGLNDSYGKNINIITFEQNLNKIVKTYLDNNIEVVLMTPVPIISKSLGLDYEINVEQYCKVIKKVSEYNKLLCIDVYKEMQQLMSNYLITPNNYEVSGHLADYTIVADIILKEIISYKCVFKKGEFIPFNTNLAYTKASISENIAAEQNPLYMNVFYGITKSDDSIIKFAYFHRERGAKFNLNVYDREGGGGGWIKNFGNNYYTIASNGVDNFNKLFEIPVLGAGLYFFEINGSSITVDTFLVSGAVIS